MQQEEHENTIALNRGEGKYRVSLYAVATGQGLSLTLTGGEQPHVGGMALSVPRESLSGDRLSCDTWVCPVPGHKDAELAASLSRMACVAAACTVAVTAGIHIDSASRQEIDILVENSTAAVRDLCQKIKESGSIERQ